MLLGNRGSDVIGLTVKALAVVVAVRTWLCFRSQCQLLGRPSMHACVVHAGAVLWVVFAARVSNHLRQDDRSSGGNETIRPMGRFVFFALRSAANPLVYSAPQYHTLECGIPAHSAIQAFVLHCCASSNPVPEIHLGHVSFVS